MIQFARVILMHWFELLICGNEFPENQVLQVVLFVVKDLKLHCFNDLFPTSSFNSLLDDGDHRIIKREA